MTETPIAALVPTLRPDNIEKLFECVDKTRTELVTWFIGLDNEDQQIYPQRDGVIYHSTPRAQLAIKTNELAELTWDNFPILAQFDDDQWPRTTGWDKQVVAAMKKLDLGGLVYTNDGWMGQQTPVCPFWPAKFAKAIGWLYHPELIHLFADNTLQELARGLGRLTRGHNDGCTTYLHDVLIEHMHPIIQKAKWDKSYEESNSGRTWAHDEAVFKDYIASDRFKDDVAKMRDVL